MCSTSCTSAAIVKAAKAVKVSAETKPVDMSNYLCTCTCGCRKMGTHPGGNLCDECAVDCQPGTAGPPQACLVKEAKLLKNR
ncbi:hypothetical protein G7046_g5441 [Stylonectria norvegica]|nr:hypothetical protein G7046_g5441 [Stylonectria norvegica]